MKSHAIFALFLFLSLSVCSFSYGDFSGVITDKSGSKVVLDKISTKTITVSMGESSRDISLSLIKKIEASDSGIHILLQNGKEISCSSSSYIKGTWELGEYSLSLDKVQSFIISGNAKETVWKKPDGAVVRIIDSKSSEAEVYGFCLNYSYSYWMSNCTWNCSKSTTSTLNVFPLNINNGTLIIPFKDIKQVTEIKAEKGYSGKVSGKVELLNGKVFDSAIGKFGNKKISEIHGKTFIGNYTLDFKKASTIIFLHDKFLKCGKKYGRWEKKGIFKADVTGIKGENLFLKDAGICSTSDSGRISSINKTLNITIGESKNNIDVSKLKTIEIKTEKDGKYSKKHSVIITTQKGSVINGILNDQNFISGFTDQGYFFYGKLQDMKKIVFK